MSMVEFLQLNDTDLVARTVMSQFTVLVIQMHSVGVG